MKNYFKNGTKKKQYKTPFMEVVINDCEIECNSSFESKDNDFNADDLVGL